MQICGIDEAGRGSLCGSLFVCGVVCEENGLDSIANLNDSKQLSRKTRDKIYADFSPKIEHFIAQFSAQEIDENGISHCLNRALEAIKNNLVADIYIFDGNCNYGVFGVQTMIKGDSKIKQISLASIFAKSLKDAECDKINTIIPQYKIAKHKGYGTKEHIELIKKYGFSKFHRRSFKIKDFG